MLKTVEIQHWPLQLLPCMILLYIRFLNVKTNVFLKKFKEKKENKVDYKRFSVLAYTCNMYKNFKYILFNKFTLLWDNCSSHFFAHNYLLVTVLIFFISFIFMCVKLLFFFCFYKLSHYMHPDYIISSSTTLIHFYH